MAKSWKSTWYVIGRGWSGWHAVGVAVRGSGGTLEGYLPEAAEGALVYDASTADESAFAKFVYSGPMVDPALEPDGWSKFGHDGDVPKALDTVGVGRYRVLLAAVPGVKFGTVRGGVVVWAEVEPVLPGAEHVRAQEIALPQFALPEQSFTLTAPEETQPAQVSLFGGRS